MPAAVASMPLITVFGLGRKRFGAEDIHELTPSSEVLRVDSACPPQLHVTTSGGGRVSCVHMSEGGSQVDYPFDLWSRLSRVVKILFRYG